MLGFTGGDFHDGCSLKARIFGLLCVCVCAVLHVCDTQYVNTHLHQHRQTHHEHPT